MMANFACQPFRRVLVVDNDRELARLIARTLRRQDLEVIVASSAAMARVLCCEFALAVCSMQLRDGSGIDLATELTADGRWESVVFFADTRNQTEVARAGSLGPVVGKDDGVEALVRIVSEKMSVDQRNSGVVSCPS